MESAGAFPYCAQFVQILGQLTACIHGLAPHIQPVLYYTSFYSGFLFVLWSFLIVKFSCLSVYKASASRNFHVVWIPRLEVTAQVGLHHAIDVAIEPIAQREWLNLSCGNTNGLRDGQSGIRLFFYKILRGYPPTKRLMLGLPIHAKRLVRKRLQGCVQTLDLAAQRHRGRHALALS